MEKEDRPVEIKDLNKTQLILLAILLSFVVSIATGVVTVTLLQQAPAGVTQTINRVVQQTIEKAVPDYVPGQTQTVVVKEDDLVVDAVSKTRSNLYTIFLSGDTTDPVTDAYSVGGGVFISNSTPIDQSKSYLVKDGDTMVPAKVLMVSPQGFAVLAVDPQDKSIKDFPKSIFGKDADIKAGQTVISISNGSIDKDTVQNVLAETDKDASGNVTDKYDSVSLGNPIPTSLSGAPVSDLDGTIVGFVSSVTGGDGTVKTQVIGIDAISELLSNASKITTSPAPGTPPTTTSP